MGWLENVIFKNQEIANERLELTDKNSLYFLSTGLTLRNCTVVLKVPASRLVIKQATFIDCTFEVKQELKNHQDWICAALKGCRFKGRLTGCDFGHWPEYGTGWEHGAIEDCDFTEAQMTGCRIMGSDPATLRFPKWPCFTLLDPIGRARELNSVQWPGKVGPIVIETLGKQPPGTVALTEDATAIAKRFGTTPEEIRAVLERFDCILY
ncbi:hypothetical protein F0U62_48100 [Cystobacter fuscus]|uniref:hypothetical protein n=1 Tax=Cystobacter fuscus TaxID=43 RepID=UPI002B2F3888|nr:hypothetical protein F0U62_48100 [Cystobacter fuscus]